MKTLGASTYHYQDFTSSDYVENNQLYVDQLLDLIGRPDVQNVGLIGAYGSGKSSVINQLIKQQKDLHLYEDENHRPRYYRKISFLPFPTTNPLLIDNPPTLKATDFKAKDDLTRPIEQEFVRQLFLGTLPEDNTSSYFLRFGKKVSAHFEDLLACTAFFGICLPGAIHLLTNNYFSLVLNLDDKFLAACLIGTFVLILISIFLLTNYYIWHFIKQLHASQFYLKRIGLKSFSAEFEKNKDNVDLFLFQDEILNYIRMRQIKVIFFEDIDRFQNPYIYEKLRQLNMNLNDALRSGGEPPITFVYAMDDTTITDPVARSKILDGSVSIIPFMSLDTAYFRLQQKFDTAHLGYFDEKEKHRIDSLLRLVAKYAVSERVQLDFVNTTYNTFVKTYSNSSNEEWREPCKIIAISAIRTLEAKEYSRTVSGEGVLYECLEAAERQFSRTKLNLPNKGHQENDIFSNFNVKTIDQITAKCPLIGDLIKNHYIDEYFPQYLAASDASFISIRVQNFIQTLVRRNLPATDRTFTDAEIKSILNTFETIYPNLSSISLLNFDIISYLIRYDESDFYHHLLDHQTKSDLVNFYANYYLAASRQDQSSAHLVKALPPLTYSLYKKYPDEIMKYLAEHQSAKLTPPIFANLYKELGSLANIDKAYDGLFYAGLPKLSPTRQKNLSDELQSRQSQANPGASAPVASSSPRRHQSPPQPKQR